MNYYEWLWEQCRAFGIHQKEREWISFIQYIQKNFDKPNILEIGTMLGGTARAFTEIANQVVSIDLHRYVNIGNWKVAYPNVTFLNMDSHNEDTLKYLQANYPKFDIAFIDGDHSLRGATKDFELYSQVVDVIALHDIIPCGDFIINQNIDVGILWNELKSKYKTIEFVDKINPANTVFPKLNELNPAIWGGIGVLLNCKEVKL